MPKIHRQLNIANSRSTGHCAGKIINWKKNRPHSHTDIRNGVHTHTIIYSQVVPSSSPAGKFSPREGYCIEGCFLGNKSGGAYGGNPRAMMAFLQLTIIWHVCECDISVFWKKCPCHLSTDTVYGRHVRLYLRVPSLQSSCQVILLANPHLSSVHFHIGRKRLNMTWTHCCTEVCGCLGLTPGFG